MFNMIQYCIPDFYEIDSTSVQSQEHLDGEQLFGFEFCESAIFSGKYGIPLLPPYHASIPERFITYSDVRNNSDRSCGVAGFDCDQTLLQYLKNLKRRVPLLSEFQCVSKPDFSLKVGLSFAIQIYSVFLSNAVAHYFVQQGLSVMPSVSWGDKPTYEFCFDGHSKGGAFLVSTIGTMKDERSRIYFRNGFQIFLRILNPEAVLLYGDTNEELLSWMPSQLDVHLISHSRFTRARSYGR